MSNTPPSDEVAAHVHRLAQANRLRRLARAEELDEDEVLAGRAMPIGIDTILGPDGKIQPEPEDYEAAEADPR